MLLRFVLKELVFAIVLNNLYIVSKNAMHGTTIPLVLEC